MRVRKLKVPDLACTTCPYRRDTPPGIWERVEYERLRCYDYAPHEQLDGDPAGALAIFHCHQENVTKVPTVCRGWLSVHRDSIAVRLAQSVGAVDPCEVPSCAEPAYYASGNEAADAGIAGVDDPGPAARLAMDRLLRHGDFKAGGEEA